MWSWACWFVYGLKHCTFLHVDIPNGQYCCDTNVYYITGNCILGRLPTLYRAHGYLHVYPRSNGLPFLGIGSLRLPCRHKPSNLFTSLYAQVFIGLPIVMVVVAVFLVVLPLFSEPVPSLTAFGVILLGIPVYIFVVMETPWRFRPKVFDRISGK